MAPAARASSRPITAASTSWFARTFWLTSVSIASICSGGTGCGHEKSKRSRSGSTSDPACCALGPSTWCSAACRRWVAGVVGLGVDAAAAMDLGAHSATAPQRPPPRPHPVHHQTGDRPLRVDTRARPPSTTGSLDPRPGRPTRRRTASGRAPPRRRPRGCPPRRRVRAARRPRAPSTAGRRSRRTRS